LANPAINPNRRGSAVGERPSRIMAGGTSHSAISGQSTIKEKLFPESDLLRSLRVVFWNGSARLVKRRANPCAVLRQLGLEMATRP